MCKRKTTDEFIRQSKKIFGKDAFDYKLTKYNTVRDIVKMQCNTCGEIFTKVAHNHLSRGQGCTNCTNKNLPGLITFKRLKNDKELANSEYRLYYIKIRCFITDNVYYKIGIEDASKISRWKTNKNYSVDFIYIETGKLKSIFIKEQTLIKQFDTGISKDLWKFGGHTEMVKDRDFLGLDI